MALIRIEALYLGRQFTLTDANSGYDTSGRVIIYDNYPKFHARAWDDGGHGEDIWFEVTIRRRTGASPPYTYTIPGGSTFNVDSFNNPNYFYDKQYYKSGEVCTINYSLVEIVTNDLDNYFGVSNIFSIQWTAYDRSTATPLATNQIEFTYIPQTQLAQLEQMNFTSFDRVTIFRPNIGTEFWLEVDAPLVPLYTNLREPFESAAKTLSLKFADPEGMYLPQSNDNINYIGTAGTGIYSPVFRLGNRVAYEHSVAYDTVSFGWTILQTYSDASRYRQRVWTLPGALRKEPWVKQSIQVQVWDGVAWVDATEGNEYDLFQYGVFFRETQTNVRATGLYFQCHWDYCGMFYMAAPTYSNTPEQGSIVSVDCQDRLSKLDSNGRVYLSTCKIYEVADFEQQREESDQNGVTAGTRYYWNNQYLKTWQDPSLPTGLLLWFYDLNGPYAGNYSGSDPIADGSAAIWNDEYEIFVEYYDDADSMWKQLDEDAYDRTIYGLLINKDWSTDIPWTYVGVGQEKYLRISFQTIVPDTNPVNEIIREILEYPNYSETTLEYGGPGLSSDDYSIPGIGGDSDDDWMGLDISRFIWNHYMGSAFDAIKEVMRIAQFPYNYRVTSEPNPSWLTTPFDAYAEDIITFREVSQYPMENVEVMVMLPMQVQQKIEADRMATIIRSRVFDDFSPNLAVEREVYAHIVWGPGNSAGLGLEYIGGFNRNPNMAPTSSKIELRREKLPFWVTADPVEDATTGDISNSWHPSLGGTNNTARGVVTDDDLFTHLRWMNDSMDWGAWPDFIATPVLELIVPFTSNPIDLAAIDIRNGEWLDITSSSEWATAQHIGIKYGTANDKALVTGTGGGLTIAGNVISNVPTGLWEDNELARNGATIEIASNAADANDVGNTYPVIANNDAAGTITVEIRDPYFVAPLNTLQGQLNNPAQGQVTIIVKNYKWLPNFNRLIHAPQETLSWELDGYVIPNVQYLEIWCIKPAAASMHSPIGGSTENDQFFDIGSIWIYDSGATIGRPLWMRIRDNIAEVPNESEDLIEGNDEFFREDLVDRLGIRTQVIPDDKSITSFEFGFFRAAQALYENLVTEDSYQIDGAYFPYFPRYSTVLINIESMRIAFPALLESRDLTFAGNNRSYRLVLRNYNNLIWPHPYEPDTYESDYIPEVPGG